MLRWLLSCIFCNAYSRCKDVVGDYSDYYLFTSDFFQNKDGLAVVLIDMQADYVRRLRTGDPEIIIPNQIAVIRYCAEHDIPLVVLEYGGCHLPTLEVLKHEVGEVKRVTMVTKSCNNGFQKTLLHSHLKKLGITKLFLMGINADHCVKSTAVGAMKNGYKIATSNGCISGTIDDGYDNSIDWYKKHGAVLIF